MNCRRARNLLTREPRVGGSGRAPELARHLAACPACASFAERWEATREALREHRATVVPDAGFAGRVVARLPAPDPFAWAARRLLPATLALTLALGGWCLLRTPAPASLAAELADGDLLSWVTEGEEEAP